MRTSRKPPKHCTRGRLHVELVKMRRYSQRKKWSPQHPNLNGLTSIDQGSQSILIECKWGTSGINTTKLTMIMTTPHPKWFKATNSTSSTQISSIKAKLRHSVSFGNTVESVGNPLLQPAKRIHA